MFHLCRFVVHADDVHGIGAYTLAYGVCALRVTLLIVPQLPDYLTDAGEMAGYVHRVGEAYEGMGARPVPTPPNVPSDGVVRVTGLGVDAPDGRPLLRDVSFSVTTGRPSTSLFLHGPSGCGKTTLFRALAGLVTSHTGTIVRPPSLAELTASRRGINVRLNPPAVNIVAMFLPQRPYMMESSLRELLVYPCCDRDLGEDVVAALNGLLGELQLRHLVPEGGACSLCNQCLHGLAFDPANRFADAGLLKVGAWDTVLSVGEQQRIGFIRVAIHRCVVIDRHVDVTVNAVLYMVMQALCCIFG